MDTRGYLTLLLIFIFFTGFVIGFEAGCIYVAKKVATIAVRVLDVEVDEQVVYDALGRYYAKMVEYPKNEVLPNFTD